jgi:hypothetical protein
MDHIFGDSDDISFGSAKPQDALTETPRARPVVAVHRSPVSRSASSHSYQTGTKSIRDNAPRPRQTSSHTQEPAIIDNTPALTRLIAGMKSSFLPREDDTSVIRVVSLSHNANSDPLFLIRQDDTSIVVGSGF